MKVAPSPRPRHFLVCTNQKERGVCCAERGSRELVESLKSQSKAEGWRRQIRVIGTSCLGHCEAGITCRLEPDGLLWTEVRPEDGPELARYLKSLLNPHPKE